MNATLVRWLTPEQAAEIVQLPARTITELCKQGRIPGAEKWGRRWRIPPSSVEHFDPRPNLPRIRREVKEALRCELASERARDGQIGSVYFVQAANGPIKIGTAIDVATRVQTLRVFSAEPLTVLGTIEGGRAVESTLHRAFDCFRMHGEWFRPEPVLLEFIEGLP